MKEISSVLGTILLIAMISVAIIGAWVQHFITTVSEELWVLLVVGAILPPVGVLHGWLVWLGVL